jgi:hypothetical protein
MSHFFIFNTQRKVTTATPSPHPLSNKHMTFLVDRTTLICESSIRTVALLHMSASIYLFLKAVIVALNELLNDLSPVVAGEHGQIPFQTIWRLQISKMFLKYWIGKTLTPPPPPPLPPEAKF